MPGSQDKNRSPAPVREFSGEWGFTLVEVLTVAAIIGILTTMAVVSMRGGRRIAFETKAIAAMKNIAENEVIYYQRYMYYGNWNQMRDEGDLIDPGYDKVDDLSTARDTPIANLYSIDILLGGYSQCFTAIAWPREASIWHLRTYAVTCDGSIMNSHENGMFFSMMLLEP
jgi:prepilin-type N-terminal cleavage/methylation domain-containing protein